LGARRDTFAGMRVFSWALAMSFVTLGCRRETPTQADPAPQSTSLNSTISSAKAQPTTSIAAPAISASAAAVTPTSSASSAAHAPTPIAAGDLEKAKQYVRGLSRGRKATVAKDYPAAVKHFDEALAAEPGDARALSERGYARLLGGELDAAAKDLEEAAKRAGGADLLRQILFNQASLAEKRGDTATADTLRAKRDELTGAKRSKSKDCSLSVSRPGTQPHVVNTFREAWNEIKTAHFRHWSNPSGTLTTPVIADQASEDAIRRALIGDGPVADGAYTIMTEEMLLRVYHVIFIRGKRIHVFDDLGGFQMGRCPFGAAPPSVVDGDLPSIQIETENLEMGYMCEVPKTNEIAPCDQVQDGNPVQSYCYWVGSTFQTFVIDPKTLNMAVAIEESVEAKGNTTFQTARPRAVITMQQDAVLVTGCGVEQRETIP
jgi:Flp pilus assembly protein TadD